MASGKWISTIGAVIVAADGSKVASGEYPAGTFTVTKNGTGNFQLDLTADFQTAWGTPFGVQVTPETSSKLSAQVTNVSGSRIDCTFYNDAGTATDPTRFHVLVYHFNAA